MRYFFHLHDDSQVLDDEGVELADHATAIDYGRQSARSLMAEDIVALGEIDLGHHIEIRTGPTAAPWRHVVNFADCIRVRSEPADRIH